LAKTCAGFDVFVDDASAVHLAKRGRKTNGELQEEAQINRRIGGPLGTECAADLRFV
jgi:hypothetical protein